MGDSIGGYRVRASQHHRPKSPASARRAPGSRATRIYTDHGVSGATACRPHLDSCLDHLREGDVLTVWKLDRLGRNTQHVLAVVDELTSRGIGFRSLTEGLHTDGPMGTAMLTIMAAFAQLERDTMIERRAGLAAAAANGRKGGRPRKVDDTDAAKARQTQGQGHHGHRHRENAGSLPRHRVPLPVRWRVALCVDAPSLRRVGGDPSQGYRVAASTDSGGDAAGLSNALRFAWCHCLDRARPAL